MPETLQPIVFTASSSSCWRRPVMKTYAPSLTKSLAVANPIPSVPPVMTATFPRNFLPPLIDLSISLPQLYISTRAEKEVSFPIEARPLVGELACDHPSIDRQGCPDNVGSLVRTNEHDGICHFFGRSDPLVRNL